MCVGRGDNRTAVGDGHGLRHGIWHGAVLSWGCWWVCLEWGDEEREEEEEEQRKKEEGRKGERAHN